MGRGIPLLFLNRGTRRGWVVSSTPEPHFTPGKDQVPILQEAGWAPGPVWTGGKSRPHRDSIPDRPVRSQSLCRQSYPAHFGWMCCFEIVMLLCYLSRWFCTTWVTTLATGCSYFRVAEASTCIFQPFNFTVDIFVETHVVRVRLHSSDIDHLKWTSQRSGWHSCFSTSPSAVVRNIFTAPFHSVFLGKTRN